MVMMLSAHVRCHNDGDDDGDGDGAIHTCEMMVVVMILSARVRCHTVGDGDIIMMMMVMENYHIMGYIATGCMFRFL